MADINAHKLYALISTIDCSSPQHMPSRCHAPGTLSIQLFIYSKDKRYLVLWAFSSSQSIIVYALRSAKGGDAAAEQSPPQMKYIHSCYNNIAYLSFINYSPNFKIFVTTTITALQRFSNISLLALFLFIINYQQTLNPP